MIGSHIILFEGCDASGKTSTLNVFKEIYGEHGIPTLELHMTGSDTCLRESYYENTASLLAQAYLEGNAVLIDRAFLSNIIYAYAFRNQKVLESGAVLKLLECIDMIVFLSIDDEDAWRALFSRSCGERHEQYPDLAKMTEAYRFYKDMALLSEKVRLSETPVNPNLIGSFEPGISGRIGARISSFPKEDRANIHPVLTRLMAMAAKGMTRSYDMLAHDRAHVRKFAEEVLSE